MTAGLGAAEGMFWLKVANKTVLLPSGLMYRTLVFEAPVSEKKILFCGRLLVPVVLVVEVVLVVDVVLVVEVVEVVDVVLVVAVEPELPPPPPPPPPHPMMPIARPRTHSPAMASREKEHFGMISIKTHN